MSPIADWPTVAAGARAADAAGLDAIGMYDHYHSLTPEWSDVCGWSAYGADSPPARNQGDRGTGIGGADAGPAVSQRRAWLTLT